MTLAETAPQIKRLLLYWLPVAVWMGLIFLLSGLSGETVGQDGWLAALPAGQDGWLAALPAALKSDILAHTVEFAVLAALLYRLLASYPSLAWWHVLGGALVLTVGYGISDEFHQSFVPGRDSSFKDVAVDTLGALVGLAAAEGSVRLRAMLENCSLAIRNS